MPINKITPQLLVETDAGARTIPLPELTGDEISTLEWHLARFPRPNEKRLAAIQRIFDEAIGRALVSLETAKTNELTRERHQNARAAIEE